MEGFYCIPENTGVASFFRPQRCSGLRPDVLPGGGPFRQGR